MKTNLIGKLLVAVMAFSLVAGCKTSAQKPPDEVSLDEVPTTKPTTEAGEGPGPTPDVHGKLPALGMPGKVKTKILLPPPNPGESVSQFEGCLAETSPSEEDGTKYPVTVPGQTRSAPPKQPFLLAPTSGGVVVEHPLEHACCLRADVTTVLDGTMVKMTERLTGTPCRCRCHSIVRTAVGLERGSYTISLDTLDPMGNRKHVGDEAVAIP